MRLTLRLVLPLLLARPLLAGPVERAPEALAPSMVFVGPAPETAPEQLSRAAQAKIEKWQAGGGPISGNWRSPAADAPTAAGEAPAELAADLANAARLDEAGRQALLERLARTKLEPRGPPAFSSDHTFSFEFEFQVHRQLKKLDLDKLFDKKPLDDSERLEFAQEGSLPEERWGRAQGFVAGRVLARMPQAWRLFSTGGSGNTLELNTGGRRSKYHNLTAKDWADLTAGLERVQSVLPAGFYSVHLHNGYGPLTDGGSLKIEANRMARVTKVFEAQLRALAGMGYRAPIEDPKDGGSNEIDYLDLDALWPYSQSYNNVRRHYVGFAYSYPTIETRVLTSLLRDTPAGPATLDPRALAGDVWWTFALMRALAGQDRFELATLGLPVTAGLVPTTKQLVAFADRLFGDDLMGKALALKRLGDVSHAQGQPLAGWREIRAREDIERLYGQLGLGVVYRLHKEHDDVDERLVEHLRADPRLLQELADDLAKAGHGHDQAVSMFPESFHEELATAFNEARLRLTVPQALLVEVAGPGGVVRRGLRKVRSWVRGS